MKKALLFLFFLVMCIRVSGQNPGNITGTITDQNGDPLPGVNVFFKNTSLGTTSGFDGTYSLTIPDDAEADTLVFSFIGYTTMEQATGNRTVIDIVLAEDTKQLEEIIITGYTSQKKQDISGAISVVDPESLKDKPLISLDQALQGQVPGVSVTQSSGTPGGGIMVRIRGSSSIGSSNTPLYIVDGIPVQSGGLSLRDFGGQNDNALSTLNPNDIKSMQVLKDASAKAIYGSRASNGVVIITTKSGSLSSGTNFELDVQRGFSQPTNTIELLNSRELLELQREALINADQDPDAAGIPGITDGVDTDWVDEVTRTAITEQYQLSVNGGADKTRFYISGAYRKEEGVMLNNEFNRWNITANIDHNVSDRLSLGINFNVARTLNKRVKGDNFLDGVYSAALTSLPYYQPYDENGNLYVPGDDGYAGFPNFNPVGQATQPRFNTYSNKVLGGLFFKYKIKPELEFTTKFSLDYIGTIDDHYEPRTSAIGGYLESVQGQGYGNYMTSDRSVFLNSNILTYNKTFKDKHEISALAGTELLSQTGRSATTTGILFPGDEYTYLTSAGLIIDGSSYYSENALFSFFSQIHYKYKNKFMASVSGRYDGSSRFGKNKKYGFFPAISGSWRITEESFFKQLNWLDDLKLRASYGLTGNERFGNFLYLGTWGATTAYNGVPSVVPANLENPDLHWEATTELNAGLDISVLSGRIQSSIDVYYNTTSDLILDETLPYTTGFGSVKGNLGKITNQGIEFALTTVNIDNVLRWSSQFNISQNQNTVKELATDQPIYRGYNTYTNSTHIIAVGSTLGTFWGLEFLGVDPASGNAIYKDLNNDGRINADDAKIIGDAEPLFHGGFTNTINYKNFDFNIFFQFSYGNEMINFGDATSLINSGADIQNNQSKKALKRWQNPGDITSVPKYEYENTSNSWFSSRFVEDASYIRLKNITLGYRIPSKYTNRIRLKSARVYATAANILTFTNYSGADPEVNSFDGSTAAQGLDLFTFPQVKTIMFGLKLEF